MTHPLSAAHYADGALRATLPVLENVQLARDTFRIRMECPEIAASIVPGQFLMMRLPNIDDPLLGRPFALYDTVLSATGQPTNIDVVYLVLGKMTRRLAALQAGQQVEVWGPLGNGFAPPTAGKHLVMVAGGIGQTPFMALAREALGQRQYGATWVSLSETDVRHGKSAVSRYERAVSLGETDPRAAPASKVTLCYGARTAEYLAGVEDFRALGVDVRLSTDDGSTGHHGLVTDLVRDVLRESPQARVVCCGPEKMMEAVSELTHAANAACQVSLETPMACGIGICFSCVAKVRDDAGNWDYRRTCVEGPVFDAGRIVW